MLDSVNMTASVTPDRWEALKARAVPLFGVCTLQQVMCFVGTIESCAPGVEAAHLYKYKIEWDKNEALDKHNWNLAKTLTLSPAALQEVQWWLEVASTHHNPLIRPPPNRRMQSDASNRGWGAVVPDADGGQGIRSQGYWPQNMREWHINAKEMMAAFFGLKAFFKNDRGAVIRLQMDNMTAVAHINKMGGTKSKHCCDLAYEIWRWALDHELWLVAEYLPGKDNVTADQLSRKIDNRLEWMLDHNIFLRLCNQLQVQPDIDLFVSAQNTQLEAYMSFTYDEDAAAVNAFNQSWLDYDLPYIFCPFSVIPRVLQRLRLMGGISMMIVPLWLTAPWLTTWCEGCVVEPVLLPRRHRLLKMPGDPDARHSMGNTLQLVCGIVCYKACKGKYFQNMQSRPFWVHGDPEHRVNITHIWPNGNILQTNKGWIRLTHLTVQ